MASWRMAGSVMSCQNGAEGNRQYPFFPGKGETARKGKPVFLLIKRNSVMERVAMIPFSGGVLRKSAERKAGFGGGGNPVHGLLPGTDGYTVYAALKMVGDEALHVSEKTATGAGAADAVSGWHPLFERRSGEAGKYGRSNRRKGVQQTPECG